MADKNKNNYLWIGIAVVAVIIIVIFFMNNSGISKINTNTISLYIPMGLKRLNIAKDVGNK